MTQPPADRPGAIAPAWGPVRAARSSGTTAARGTRAGASCNLAWQRTTMARRFGELKDDLARTRRQVLAIEMRIQTTEEEVKRYSARGIRRILILIDPERGRQQRTLESELRRLEEDRQTLHERLEGLESQLAEARRALTAADRGRRC